MTKYYESQQTILERMLGRVTGLNILEGSTAYIQQSPIAIELENIKLQMDEIINRNNIVSAYENGYTDEVIRFAEADGVDRKQAHTATGIQTFYGTPNTVIPVGSKFGSQSNGLMYETVLEGKIDSTGSCDILAVSCDKGLRYNAKTNTLNYLPIAIAGVTGTTNKADYVDGADEESIDDLFYRHQLKVRTPATSGNKYHYEQWALEVSGVGYAKCIPAEQVGQGGVVNVYIADSNKKGASDDLVTKVYNHIEEARPILAGTLNVESVKEIAIEITADVEIDTTTMLNKVQTTFNELLNEYFDDLVYTKRRISISKISAILMDIDGVIDCANVKINNLTTNISINEDEIAVLKNVDVGVM